VRHNKTILRVASLAGCGGLLWMWGAGSCVPFNFYADLLGNTIITGVTSAVLTSVLTAVGVGT
jgi:hypothetical protein